MDLMRILFKMKESLQAVSNDFDRGIPIADAFDMMFWQVVQADCTLFAIMCFVMSVMLFR